MQILIIWTFPADCFRGIIDNYAPLQQLYQSCMTKPLKTDVKSRVTGCLSPMERFKFPYALKIDNLMKLLPLEKLFALYLGR